MINYPNKLDIIFDKLKTLNIKPILVGGYIRDKLLELDSKDIDIELYGVDSLEKVENILCEFGEVNSVGKSFGVCKLSYAGIDLDFSLPREDSKISEGHRGFSIKTYKDLDFKTAASRRDFTINAMGYDIVEKKLLDPFNGLDDLKNSLIRAVDLQKFGEDPLRVLRAVQFSARFEFRLNKGLFLLCKVMVTQQVLDELPKERIFEEIKKLLLKSKKPSLGFILLKRLQSSLYYHEFETMLNALDYLSEQKIEDSSIKLILMLTILSYKLHLEEVSSFLNSLTAKRLLHREVLSLLKEKNLFSIERVTNYDLYRLALHVDIEKFLLLLDAVSLGKNKKRIQCITLKAQKLNILHTKAKALIQGKDLIELGYKPSAQFSILLDKIYDAQINSKFTTHDDAIKWIQIHLH